MRFLRKNYRRVVLANRYTFLIIGAVLVLWLQRTLLEWEHQHVLDEFKKSISKDLKQIHNELVKSPIRHYLRLRFEETLLRLDSSSLRKPSIVTSKVNNDPTQRVVCPEIFLGEEGGYPYYQKGWVITNCADAKPIKSVVSILMNTVDYSNNDFNRLQYVLDGIKATYPTVDVLLMIQNKQSIKDLNIYPNVKVFKDSSSSQPVLGQTWNKLIKEASTPYVLIARDIVHFSWLSQLERLVRVVSEIPTVEVAGGSFRNLSGHWKMGCYQTTMKNYVLEYQEGYLYSRNECMLCDYLQGPFVAKKSVLNFDETMSDEVVFEDLFHSLTTKGMTVLGCPDAMYFTMHQMSYPKQEENKVWQSFAKKWILNRIVLSCGVKHSFSCNDIDFKCDLRLTRSILLPVCCQEQYEHALAVFKDFANKHNFPYELDTGSVLGTVKFNGLMPWDVDGDVRILKNDLSIFNKEETIEYFIRHGLNLTEYEAPKYRESIMKPDGTVRIKMPELHIELWGRKRLTCPQFLPKDLQNNFTLVQVRETWIKTVFSPGLFVRNRYGVENLKHSQSWIIKGMKHSTNQYHSGNFMECENPDHHSCIYQFPADGNIPFLVS